MSQLSSQSSFQPNTAPSNDDYASAVIAAVGTRAAYDAEPTPGNLDAFRRANDILRQIRDARQRAAARNAGL
jgi:hypothetical protein